MNGRGDSHSVAAFAFCARDACLAHGINIVPRSELLDGARILAAHQSDHQIDRVLAFHNAGRRAGQIDHLETVVSDHEPMTMCCEHRLRVSVERLNFEQIASYISY